MIIPPLKIRILLESNPPKSRISVRRLAVRRVASSLSRLVSSRLASNRTVSYRVTSRHVFSRRVAPRHVRVALMLLSVTNSRSNNNDNSNSNSNKNKDIGNSFNYSCCLSLIGTSSWTSAMEHPQYHLRTSRISRPFSPLPCSFPSLPFSHSPIPTFSLCPRLRLRLPLLLPHLSLSPSVCLSLSLCLSTSPQIEKFELDEAFQPCHPPHPSSSN